MKLDSPGPILFRQRRYGFNNDMIEVFKFRSMYIDAEDREAARLVTRDDPRVTRVGRFIRRTSLDELPQLFNVNRGDLSLVGPRPHAVSAKAAKPALHRSRAALLRARHRVKPHHGLGADQWLARGDRYEEKLVRRVEHDLYYIDNWSVLFDSRHSLADADGAPAHGERVLALRWTVPSETAERYAQAAMAVARGDASPSDTARASFTGLKPTTSLRRILAATSRARSVAVSP